MTTPEQIQQIKTLRKAGVSYRKIATIVSCDVSLVYYHADEKHKQKTRCRDKAYKENNPLWNKLQTYRARKNAYGKTRDFQRGRGGNGCYVNQRTYEFTLADVLKHIGENPKCYLTGVPIDLSDSESYQFDHEVPVSKGGDNSLENLRLSSKQANIAKNRYTLEEFVNMCRQVVLTHGSK